MNHQKGKRISSFLSPGKDIEVTIMISNVKNLRSIYSFFSKDDSIENVKEEFAKRFGIGWSHFLLTQNENDEKGLDNSAILEDLLPKKEKELKLYAKKVMEIGSREIGSIGDGIKVYQERLKRYHELMALSDKKQFYLQSSKKLLEDAKMFSTVYEIMNNVNKYFPGKGDFGDISDLNMISTFLLLNAGGKADLRNIIPPWQLEMLKYFAEPFETAAIRLSQREGRSDPLISIKYEEAYIPIWWQLMTMHLFHEIIQKRNETNASEVCKGIDGIVCSTMDQIKVLLYLFRKGGSARTMQNVFPIVKKTPFSCFLNMLFGEPEEFEGSSQFRAGPILEDFCEKWTAGIFSELQTNVYNKLLLDPSINHINRMDDGKDFHCKCVGVTKNPRESTIRWHGHKDKNSSARTIFSFEPSHRFIVGVTDLLPAGENAEMTCVRTGELVEKTKRTECRLWDRGGQGLVNLGMNASNACVSGSNFQHQIKTYRKHKEPVKKAISCFNTAMGHVRAISETGIGNILAQVRFLENGFGEFSHDLKKMTRMLKFACALVNSTKLFHNFYLIGAIDDAYIRKIRRFCGEYCFFKSTEDPFSIRHEGKDKQVTTIETFRKGKKEMKLRQYRNIYEHKADLENILPFLNLKEYDEETKKEMKRIEEKIPFEEDSDEETDEETDYLIEKKKSIYDYTRIDEEVYGISKTIKDYVVFHGRIKIVHPTMRYDEPYPSLKEGEYGLDVYGVFDKRSVKPVNNKIAWPKEKLISVKQYNKNKELKEKEIQKKKNDYRLQNVNSPFLKRTKRVFVDKKTGFPLFYEFKNREDKQTFLSTFGLSLLDEAPMDGLCWLQSIVRSIFGRFFDERDIKLAIAALKKWVLANKDDETVSSHLIDYSSIDQYFKGLEAGRIWGGTLEMKACSEVYGVKINAIASNSGYVCTFEPKNYKKGQAADVFLLNEIRRNENTGEILPFHFDPCLLVDENRFKESRLLFEKSNIKEEQGISKELFQTNDKRSSRIEQKREAKRRSRKVEKRSTFDVFANNNNVYANEDDDVFAKEDHNVYANGDIVYANGDNNVYANGDNNVNVYANGDNNVYANTEKNVQSMELATSAERNSWEKIKSLENGYRKTYKSLSFDEKIKSISLYDKHYQSDIDSSFTLFTNVLNVPVRVKDLLAVAGTGCVSDNVLDVLLSEISLLYPDYAFLNTGLVNLIFRDRERALDRIPNELFQKEIVFFGRMISLHTWIYVFANTTHPKFGVYSMDSLTWPHDDELRTISEFTRMKLNQMNITIPGNQIPTGTIVVAHQGKTLDCVFHSAGNCKTICEYGIPINLNISNALIIGPRERRECAEKILLKYENYLSNNERDDLEPLQFHFCTNEDGVIVIDPKDGDVQQKSKNLKEKKKVFLSDDDDDLFCYNLWGVRDSKNVQQREKRKYEEKTNVLTSTRTKVGEIDSEDKQQVNDGEIHSEDKQKVNDGEIDSQDKEGERNAEVKELILLNKSNDKEKFFGQIIGYQGEFVNVRVTKVNYGSITWREKDLIKTGNNVKWPIARAKKHHLQLTLADFPPKKRRKLN